MQPAKDAWENELMDDVKTIQGMIDKYLADGEYELVSELAEVADHLKRYAEMKEWETKQAKIDEAMKNM